MRTAKGARSKDQMIEAAIGLMRRTGLTGAGINEIVRASGAPKGSIYHFFPHGKQQIAGEALAVYKDKVHVVFDEALSSARSPGEKIKALFRTLEQRLERAGHRQSCAVGAVCLDLDQDMEGVRLAATAAFADWAQLISEHFNITDQRRCHSFARFVVTAIQGAYVRGRAEHSSMSFREASLWLAEIAEREAAT